MELHHELASLGLSDALRCDQWTKIELAGKQAGGCNRICERINSKNVKSLAAHRSCAASDSSNAEPSIRRVVYLLIVDAPAVQTTSS
jgi:hypothetical protein